MNKKFNDMSLLEFKNLEFDDDMYAKFLAEEEEEYDLYMASQTIVEEQQSLLCTPKDQYHVDQACSEKIEDHFNDEQDMQVYSDYTSVIFMLNQSRVIDVDVLFKVKEQSLLIKDDFSVNDDDSEVSTLLEKATLVEIDQPPDVVSGQQPDIQCQDKLYRTDDIGLFSNIMSSNIKSSFDCFCKKTQDQQLIVDFTDSKVQVVKTMTNIFEPLTDRYYYLSRSKRKADISNKCLSHSMHYDKFNELFKASGSELFLLCKLLQQFGTPTQKFKTIYDKKYNVKFKLDIAYHKLAKLDSVQLFNSFLVYVASATQAWKSRFKNQLDENIKFKTFLYALLRIMNLNRSLCQFMELLEKTV